MYILKNASSIDEAVGLFYEDPDKYSKGPAIPTMSKPVAPAPAKDMKKDTYAPPQGAPPHHYTKDSKAQSSYDPPAYAPPRSTAGASRRRPHTNQVIEAGNIRARDEVR